MFKFFTYFSSTLRIARDFIILTKKNSVCSVVFLSRTFYEAESIKKNDVSVN